MIYMVFDKFIMNMIYIWLFLKIMIGFHNDEVKKKNTNNLFNIDVIIIHNNLHKVYKWQSNAEGKL